MAYGIERKEGEWVKIEWLGNRVAALYYLKVVMITWEYFCCDFEKDLFFKVD